ncbi:MAG: cell division protein ZapA [Gammaproteobacteria bacterium]|nr:cell division protein ZapA [Gammaproteobacteria bacterium]
MKSDPVAVTINILDKEFRIACPEEERESLLRSAQYLNSKMREVRESGKVVGIDRVSVMASLNIVHELLQNRSSLADYERQVTPRLLSLQNRIEHVLDKNRQIEF